MGLNVEMSQEISPMSKAILLEKQNRPVNWYVKFLDAYPVPILLLVKVISHHTFYMLQTSVFPVLYF